MENKSIWYKLDNAAKIYPATRRRNWNAVFRIAAVMKETVRPEILECALMDIRPRFPSFFVQLRSGFFWYYLEFAPDCDVIEKESLYPCRPISFGDGNKPLFRVLYYDKRIAVEFFHSITDGNGGLIFLKTLLGRYLELLEHNITKSDGVLDCRDIVDASETEDSFQRIYNPKNKAVRNEPRSYKYKVQTKDNFLKVIHGYVSMDDIKLSAKKYNATVTEYLTSVYAYSYYLNANRALDSRPVRISVPVNLRNSFNSKSLRNFSSYINVNIDQSKQDYDFEKVINEIKEEIKKGKAPEVLIGNVSKNVADEKSLLLRIVPLFVKNIALKLAYTFWGESKFTSSLSNLGVVKLPEDMKQYVDRFEFLLGASPDNALNCSVIGYDGRINICFTSTSEDTLIQKTFFSLLAKSGINVELDGNI